ncbi:MAG: AraC family transcriptional regulator [Clostridia bacterium]|nr:AraC family transcriptional regulator [Clostridia bacterium]
MMKKERVAVYQDAVAYMKDHLFDKLRVNDIARHCMVCTSGLEKHFARCAKKGVMRYFLDLKLEYAADMLKKGYSVNYLAKILNFSSSAHFSMAFKKKYGTSPLKYKYSEVNIEVASNY